MVTAIVLAGAAGKEFGVNSRAMVKVGGVTMLDRVVGALKDNADRILIVGDVTCSYNAEIYPPKKSLMENIDFALGKCEGDYILLCTSDIPFITEEAVKDFVDEGIKYDVGFVYPICRKEKCLEMYPTLKRTYVKIKDGEFTGGNIMLMKRSFLAGIMPIMQELYEARKSPLKLAKMIGFDIIWRLLLCKICPSVLDKEFLENKISALFGERVKAYISPDPSICEDLDSPEELAKFEEIIKKGD